MSDVAVRKYIPRLTGDETGLLQYLVAHAEQTGMFPRKDKRRDLLVRLRLKLQKCPSTMEMI